MRKIKHGLCKHPIYKTWINMKSRCGNPNASKYNLYGGKGIKVCEEWENNVQAFYDWSMSNGWEIGLTIDRKNGNMDYSPDNCQWVTYRAQNNNTSQNHLIEYNGKCMNIAQWANYLGISYKMLSERIRRGWSTERALTTENVKSNGFNFGEFIKNENIKNDNSNIVYITANGKTMSISEWAKELNVGKSTLFARLRAGLSDSEIINKPIQKRGVPDAPIAATSNKGNIHD